ncbi:MAG: hypothetical protein RQ745_08840 [Longimicrobiales bacterium]|nr:hypothetical protein [Longimicrobiales bacterium]
MDVFRFALKAGLMALVLLAFTGPNASGREVSLSIECSTAGCTEGCTSGSECRAHEKCVGGDCMPTVMQRNCLPDDAILP